jgi:hypothetical protein
MPTKRRSSGSSKRQLKTGSVTSFYNVATKRKERGPIDGIISRSNKKGRTIKLAYTVNKYDEKLFRIISNTKSKKSRRSKSPSRSKRGKKSSRR